MADLIVRLLPASLRPFAKAVIPAAATLVAVVSQILASGSFDSAALITAIAGVVVSVVTFLVPNK